MKEDPHHELQCFSLNMTFLVTISFFFIFLFFFGKFSQGHSYIAHNSHILYPDQQGCFINTGQKMIVITSQHFKLDLCPSQDVSYSKDIKLAGICKKQDM